jgi:hypothetical protein
MLSLLLVAASAGMVWPTATGTATARAPYVPAAGPVTSDRVTPAVETTAAADPRALPARSGAGRRVVYSLSGQRVWLVGASGHVQRSYLVSGKLRDPGPRAYRVYSKSRWTRSAVSPETMRLMVRFTHGRHRGAPIGFHTIPRDRRGRPAQQVSQLGQPISHGCIRQRWSDALALWRFAHVGTRVVVIR